MTDAPEYEPLNVPRPVWWLLLAAVCLLFALLFLFAMFTYTVNPATDCSPSSDGITCDEIPGAPVVFASAAGIAAILTLGSLVVFLATGGLATLPWLRQRLAEGWSYVRRRVRLW